MEVLMPYSAASASPQEQLVHKLETVSVLTDEERRALLSLPMNVKSFPADQDIVREGDSPSECCLVLSGFACRYKVLPNGRRQIMAFHIPLDIPDLRSFHVKPIDHSVGTLTPTRAAFIPHRALRELTHRHPGITNAFWRDTLISSAIFLEWIVNVGRRSAHQRVAHQLCEIAMRLQAVGLNKAHSFRLPITQAELADALGISAVHTNRVLQDLRRDGLIEWEGSKLTLLDWEGLVRLGEFSPVYLHLNREEDLPS